MSRAEAFFTGVVQVAGPLQSVQENVVAVKLHPDALSVMQLESTLDEWKLHRIGDSRGHAIITKCYSWGVFGFFLLYGINTAYKLWLGHDGLGFGDVKLMGMYGIWLGPSAILPILFFSALIGAFSRII